MIDRIKRWLGRKPQPTPDEVLWIDRPEAWCKECDGFVFQDQKHYCPIDPIPLNKSGRPKRGL